MIERMRIPSFRTAALLLLIGLSSPHASADEEAARDRRQLWCRECVDRLGSADADIRASAIGAISKLEPARSARPILMALKEPTTEAVWDGLLEAMRQGDPAGWHRALVGIRGVWPAAHAERLGSLMHRLQRGEGYARGRINEILAWFREHRTLRSGDPRVAQMVALGKDAVDPLLAVVSDATQRTSFEREVAAIALAELLPRSRIDELETLAMVPAGDSAWARAVARHSGEEVRNLLLTGVVNGQMSLTLTRALAPYASDPAVEKELVRYMDRVNGLSGEMHLRFSHAAQFAGEHGYHSALPVLNSRLRAFLHSAREAGPSDWYCTALVARAALQLGDIQATAPLRAVLRRGRPPWASGAPVRAIAGEALNALIGRKVYRVVRVGGKDNGPRAAEEFRLEIEKFQAAAKYDKATRRWTWPRG